jgi:hypothetical protein
MVLLQPSHHTVNTAEHQHAVTISRALTSLLLLPGTHHHQQRTQSCGNTAMTQKHSRQQARTAVRQPKELHSVSCSSGSAATVLLLFAACSLSKNKTHDR